MAVLCQNWDAIVRREPTLDHAAERLPNVGATSGESTQLPGVNHISQLQAKFSDKDEEDEAGEDYAG